MPTDLCNTSQATLTNLPPNATVSWSSSGNISIQGAGASVSLSPAGSGQGSVTATIQTSCGTSSLAHHFQWVSAPFFGSYIGQICLNNQYQLPYTVQGGILGGFSADLPGLSIAHAGTNTIQVVGTQEGSGTATFIVHNGCGQFNFNSPVLVTNCNPNSDNPCCNSNDESCCVAAFSMPNPAIGEVQISITDLRNRGGESQANSQEDSFQLNIQNNNEDKPVHEYQLRVRHSQTGVVALEQNLGAVLQPVQFNVSGWAKGVYVVEVSDGAKVYFSRLVVQ